MRRIKISRHALWSLLWLTLVALLAAVAQSQSDPETLTLTLNQRTGGALYVSWTASNPDNIGSYGVILNDSLLANVSSWVTTYNAYGLVPDTLYNVTLQGTLVVADNNGSTTITSNPLMIKTVNAATTPDRPRAVELVTADGGFLRVRVPLPSDTGGANLSTIVLTVRSMQSPSDFWSLSNAASEPELTVYGLMAKTMYRLGASVANSAGLTSPQSYFMYMSTIEAQYPGPCPAPTVLNVTGGSIGLQLMPPIDRGGAPITGYVVYMAVNGSGVFEEVANTVMSNDFYNVDIRRLPGQPTKSLIPHTRYDVKAVAVNMADVCLNPSSVNNSSGNITTVWTTEASVPEAPPAPYVLSALGSLVSIQLLIPGNMRGANLTGFSIMVDGSVYASVNASGERSFDITSLAALTTYSIQVAVTTDIGVSDWSSEVVVSTSNSSVPSTPGNLTVAGISSSQAAISWTPPVNSGGASITDYRLTLLSSHGVEIFYTGGGTSYLLNTLVADTVYTAKVVAMNAAARESTTTRIQGVAFQTLMPTPPSEPRAVRSVSSTGGILEISWQAPETSGGVRFEDLLYNATLFPVGSCFNSSSDDVCQGCSLVRVPASNEQYNPTDGAQNCVRPVTPTCADGTVACCLTASNSSFGAGLLCSLITGQGRSRIVSGGSTLTSFEGLNQLSTYYVGVEAINSLGRSKTTPIIGLRTGSQTAPGYPASIRLVNSTGGSVVLSWSPPLDTGGTAIIGYNVYRDYRQLTSSHVNPPYSDCGLIANSQYVYGVSAVTASLVKGAMGSILVNTPPVTLPNPIELSLVTRTVSWMNVAVTTSCDSSGSTAPSYKYEVRKSGIVVASNYFVCCSFVISDLEAGINYDVSVFVTNEAGALNNVTSTFSTTTGIPLAPQWQLQRQNSYSLLFSTTPTTNPDREILSYDVQANQDSVVILQETLHCSTSIGSGQWGCPETYRLDGLNPRHEYNVSVRANGVRGSSDWSMARFPTSDEAAGVFMIASQDYAVNSGDTINIMVRRVNGTAGPATVTIDVTQPETVVIHCECQQSIGCACGLHLQVSGISNTPGVFQFLDGQGNQTLQVTVWEDDDSAPQSMNVLLNLIGDNVIPGTPSQALINVSPSQRTGSPCFIRSKTEVLENAPYVKVNVIRVKGASGPITFDVETFDISAKASKHYLPLVKTVVQLNDRQSLASFSIQLVDNSYYEGDRVFGIRLHDHSSFGHATTQQVVITRRIVILDDEDPSMVLPAIPRGVYLVRATGGELELSWQLPNSTTSVGSVGGYVVRAMRAPTSSTGAPALSTFNISAAPCFILSSLESRTLYRVQVAAWNQYGMSESSAAFLAMTTVPSPPSGPRNFGALETGSSTIKLVWDPPRDTGGSMITGYVIWLRGEDNVFRPLVNLSLPASSYLVENLNALTLYEFQIAAATDVFPASWTESKLAYLAAQTSKPTVAGKPPPPELMRPATGGSLSFLIREPTDLGGTYITNYALYLRRAPSIDEDGAPTSSNDEPFQVVCSDATPWVNDSSARSCAVYKLLASTSYEVYTVLDNEKGLSPPSDRVVVQTKPSTDLPSPPENFGPSQVTAGNIYLSWDRPLDLGGAADVLGYTVFQKTDVYFSDDFFTLYDGRDSTDRQLAVKGLRRSTTYGFAIVAQTAASYCVNLAAQQMSQFITVTTLSYSQISPPQNLWQVSASGGMIMIAWDDPDDLAGIDLSGYTVELIVSRDGVDEESALGTTYWGIKEFSHTNLNELTTYRYVVRAFNQDGPGERSEILAFTTTSCTAPAGVLNTQYLAESGGRVKISWAPPEDTGGRSIIYYRVSRAGRADGDFTTTSLSFTDVNGLTANTEYMYVVRAFNELYMGKSVDVWTTTGNPTVPGSAVLTGIVPFGGRIEANWASPQDSGGIPIIEYVATLLDSNGDTAIAWYRGNETSYTFTSLSANTNYNLSLQAVNNVGPGPTSYHRVATGPADLPSAPPPPTASEISGGSMRLTVYPPTDNGGDSIALALHDGSSVVYVFAQGEPSVVVQNLVALTTYHFHTIASNSRGGTSGDNLEVSTGEISQPSVVESVTLTGASFDRLTIAWPGVQDTGGDADLQYVVSFVQSDETGAALPTSEIMHVTTSSLTASLLDLENTTFYAVSVQALTSSGLRGASSPTAVFATEKPSQGRITAQDEEVIVREDAPIASVQVLRVEGSYGEIQYAYETADETALAGINYVPANGMLTMASGDKTATIDIVLKNDANYEPNTTFLVRIRDGPTGNETQTRVVMLDDSDAGFISFVQPQFSFPENVGMAAVTISRYGAFSPTAVIEAFVVVAELAEADRFTLLNPVITFNAGDAEHDLAIVINDDSVFRYWPDSVLLGFRILSGGVVTGNYSTANVTALDDGDISPAKEITDLEKVTATGGAVELRWLPPLDRGGTDVELRYSLSFSTESGAVLNATTSTTSVIVYNLKASTMYEVVVFANNPGVGLPSQSWLIGTTGATPPSAPLNVSVVAASSSSLLLTWAPPLDAGGSPVIEYKIYHASSDGTVTRFSAVSCSMPNVCSIQGLVALTYYSIQVQAFTASVSDGGELSTIAVCQTSDPTAPDPPPAANVSAFSAGAMTIKMFKPYNDGGAAIQYFRLFMRGPLDESFTQRYEGTADTFTVYRLERSSSYEIKYQVNNSVGASVFGPAISHQTLERSLPSGPLDLVNVSATGGAIEVGWQEPLDIGGRPISGYTVFVRARSSADGTSTVADWVGYDGRGNAATRGIVYGLNASTTYSMYAIAWSEVSNCYSSTEVAASDPAQLSTTIATPPAPAPTLLLVRTTGGLIELTWTPPIDTGGVPITSYTLFLVAPTGTVSTALGSNQLSFIHNDLIESTVYTYMIKATTSVGASPMTAPIVVKTLIATAPSVPRDLRQLDYVTGGAIQIGWSRPLDTGGQPLDYYWIYRDGKPLADKLPASTTTFTDNQNLQAETAYQYTIIAFSRSTMGSQTSAPFTARTTAATRPKLPVLISNSTDASFIRATWAADPDTGGKPVSLFDVKLLQGNAVVGTYTGLDTSFTFTRLFALTSYTLQLVTQTTSGASDMLSIEFTTSKVTLPAPPLAPEESAVFGGSVTVQVSVPVDTGGAAITELRLYEATMGRLGNVTVAAGVLKTQVPVFGLIQLTSYTITATAVNVLGEGGSSPVLVVQTKKTNLPGAILVAPILTGATGTTLSVTWLAPLDTGGDAALEYEVMFLDTKTAAPLNFLSTTRVTQGIGLNYITSYSISVRAVSSAGNGSWSPSLAAKTLPDAAGEFNFAATATSVSEAAGTVALTVTRTNGLSGSVVVAFTLSSSGSNAATIGLDYGLSAGSTETSATTTFSALQVSAVIPIAITNDGVYETPDEQFTVQLVSATVVGASQVIRPTIGVNASAVVTILDDGDAGTVGFANQYYPILEDAVYIDLPIIRQGGTSGLIVLNVTLADGTATGDRDYRRAPGLQVSMVDGQKSTTVRVFIINDRIFEFPDEIFTVQVVPVSGGALSKNRITTVVIMDDGDVSAAAAPPTPVVLATTGGAVTLGLGLPAHNGSSKGVLINYVVRILNPATGDQFFFNTTVAFGSTATVGWLQAQTSYGASVAATNMAGLSPFSAVVAFTTTTPTLPAVVTSISQTKSTGGSIGLKWVAPSDTGGISITKYRVYLITPANVPQLIVEIPLPQSIGTLRGLVANTTYRFAVQAGNGAAIPVYGPGWGAISPPVSFTTPAATLPAATIISPDAYLPSSGGSITISWTPPFDTGGANIVRYDVYARTATTGFSLAAQATEAASRSIRIEELYASSLYEIFVLSINSVSPTSLVGEVSCSSGSSSLTTSQDLSKTVSTGDVVRAAQGILIIGDMAHATKGTLPLRVPFMGFPVSKASASIIGSADSFANLTTNAASIPQVPPSVVLVNATGGALTFRVESPGDTGGVPIDDFTVRVNDNELSGDTVRRESTMTTSLKKTMVMRISNLAPLAQYVVTAVAVNAISLCDFSKKDTSAPAAFPTTDISQPEPPVIAVQSVSGGGMVLILMDPFDKGGSPITRYQLYMAPNVTAADWNRIQVAYAANDSTATRPSATVAGLQPLTTYDFMLSVNNGFFESANSSVSTIATSIISPPGQCRAPTLVAATGGMLAIAWDDPLDNGGADITDFVITLQGPRISPGVPPSKRTISSWAARNYTFYGLDDETDYVVVVRARNSRGLGVEGVPATLSTIKGSPPQGNIGVSIVSSTGGAAMISFNEPLDFGGTPRGDMVYNVYVEGVLVRTLSFADVVASLTTPTTQSRRLTNVFGITVGGLDPLGLYSIQIQPRNKFNSGTVSRPSLASTTEPTRPSAPQSLQSAIVTGGSVSLQWQAPSDTGGLPLDGYVVYIGSSTTGPFDVACRETITECRVTSLSAATTYSFYATTRNSLGESPQTAVISVTTAAVSLPSAPGKADVISVSETAIEASWSLSVDTGGAPIATYTVNVNDLTLGGALTPITTSTATVSISGLSPTTTYSITVTATNQLQRVSAESFPLIVVTSSTTNTPAEPTVSCVSATAVSLSWYPYPGATRYRVKRDGAAIYTGTATNAVDDNGIASGTDYFYTVEAEIGGAWTGKTSLPVTAHTTDDSSSKEVTCSSSRGFIRERNYAPSIDKSWLLTPPTAFKILTINFATFDLECDHDFLSIENADDGSQLWSGGCLRMGTFVFQWQRPVRLRLHSDATVQKSGFELYFETDRLRVEDAPTRIPVPRGPSGYVCAGHGLSPSGAVCKCSVGFTGEACNNYIVCCADATRCSNPICGRDPSKVIVVSDEFGDDTSGTGAMMDTSDKGTSSKAVKTLSKALSLTKDGDFVFVYPGEYKGSLNRELQINTRKDLTIVSLKGFAWTTINCEGAARAMQVTSSSASIQGFTIRNGLTSTPDSDGGSISAVDSTLTLQDVYITHSEATRSGGAIAGVRSSVTAIATSMEKTKAQSGGGVYLVDSQLSLTQSNVTACKATDGAGLLLAGKSSVTGGDNALISSNVATGDGGGVLLRSGQFTFKSIQIVRNEASRGGGVLAHDGGDIVFEGCQVLKNKASTDGAGMAIVGSVTVSGKSTVFEDNTAVGSGGGIHVRGLQVTITFDVSGDSATQTRLRKNTAASGSGLFVVSSTLTLSGLSIQNGTASVNGGGMCVDTSQVTLANVNISSNTAASMGGGMFVTSSEIVSQVATVVDLNVASVNGGGLLLDNTNVGGDLRLLGNNAALQGGGFHAHGTTNLVGVTIASCSADQGGGGYLNQATMKITTVTVSGCTAATSGGGLYMSVSALTAVHSTVDSGAAVFGGGVYVFSDSSIAGDLVISGSKASENGGALYATDKLTLSDLVATGSAAKRGAGMFTESATVVANNVTITSCHASLQGGGWSSASSALTLTDVHVEDGTSDDMGGGMAFISSSVTHNNVNVVGSKAKTGGGLYVATSSFTATPVSADATGFVSTIEKNKAREEGGNVYVEGISILSALLISGGTSGGRGGGIAMRRATVAISQCVVRGNIADVQGGGLSLRDQSSCDLGISFVNQNVASGVGGAVSIEDSVLTHNSIELHLNQAPNGGGFALAGKSSILIFPGSEGSLLNASVAIPSSPTVGGKGSGFYVAPMSEVMMSGMYVYQGLAVQGGLYVDTASVQMEGCQFVYNNADTGGALYVNPLSVVTVVKSQFYASRATKNGGAVQLQGSKDDDAVASFDDCDFTDNYAEQVGGAVSVESATLTLLNSRFHTNTIGSKDGGGGAVGATMQGKLIITHCVFGNNTVRTEDAKGGSLYLLADTTATITRTDLLSDELSILVREGGIAYIGGKGSKLSLVDCDVAFGQSYSGGAIYVQEAALSLVRSTIREGYAYEFGGGVYIDSGIAEIVNTSITDGNAFYDGGGIYTKGKSKLTLQNATIENNRVQDGGAGLYVAPGGGAFVTISASSFVMNRNRGLGSAIFMGRKNTLTMTTSELLGNGWANTEGGGLYAVDAQVTVTLSMFLGNQASRGAALELSRGAVLTMANCNLADNQATVSGGAIYMSMLAVATIEDTSFRNNSAVDGGVAYLVGSPKLTLRRSSVTANIAQSVGGGFALLGGSRTEIDRSVLALNRAYTGGAIAATENATLVLTSTEISSNTANDFGGGVFIDTLRTSASQAIQVQSITTRDNTARAGVDVYWVYHAWFTFACTSCVSSSSSAGTIRIASSPVQITAGWWPTAVTSGVTLGTAKPSWTSPATSAPAPAPSDVSSAPGASPGPGSPGNRRLTGSTTADTSGGTLDAVALASIIANVELTSPFVDTLWPTIVVRDFYGAIADQDNRTHCIVTKMANEMDDFDFYPASLVNIDRGYITFVDALVLSESRPTPYGIFVSCSLADDTARNLSLALLVSDCQPGYENVEGRCEMCKKGMYSLDGVKCYLCPLGATCEKTDASKAMFGVSVPTRAEGYYLYASRDSFLQSNCLDPSKWDDNDPCKNLVNASAEVAAKMTYRLQHCSKNPTFDKYWPRKRVFACLAGLEYYACDTRDACIAEGTTNSSATSTPLPTTAPAASASAQPTSASAQPMSGSAQAMAASSQAPSMSTSTKPTQCDAGYGSLTCATCLSGYYKVSNGTCKPCTDDYDPNVARMTRLVAFVPVGFIIIAVFLVWFYFSNATESEIMKQARAARKFQIYDPHSGPHSLVLAAKFFVQQRIDNMMERARESLERRRRGQMLFGIQRRRVRIPAFRAEKFKILLAFFQIFGGFKKLYEIPWPNQMSRLMDLFSIADFSLVDTTGIECFIYKDYFANYRMSLIAVLVLLFLTMLLLSWGVVRYRVKLAGLPRHCVKCGLPVFQMLRQQPKTLVRRATMVSMLRIERKMQAERMRRRSFTSRAKDAVLNKVDTALSRVKSWWAKTLVGKILERFLVFTRLPASCSEHHPSCPTSQQIESEVLAMVLRSNLRLWRARVRLRLNYRSFQNKCIKLFFWIMLLFYPELSQRVIGMFYCDEIGSSFYMSRDKSQLCYKGTWLYYLPMTMLLLVVWVAGVPILFWTIIFVKRRSGVDDQMLLLQDPSHAQLKERFLQEMRQDLFDRGIHVDEFKLKTFEMELMAEFLRNKKLSEPSMIAQVGFIYHSYRTQYWWFEVWDLGRKLFLNCVVGLLAKTGANRIIAGLIIFLIYLSVMLFCQPYKDRSDSALAGVTQIQLFVTLFCGLMLKMGTLHLEDSVVSLLTYTAFLSNALTMLFAFCSILYEKFDGTRRARRRAREDHRRAIRSHVRKLWRKAYGYAFTEVYLRDPSIRPMPIQVIFELARRDREAKQEREMELQLARSLHVRDDDNDEISSSQVEFDLPRPRDVLSPRAASALSSSASFNEKADDEPSQQESEVLAALEATDEVGAREDNQESTQND